MRRPRPPPRATLRAALPLPPRPALALLATSALAGFAYRHYSSSSTSNTGTAGADEESPVLHPRLFTSYLLTERTSVSEGNARKNGDWGSSLFVLGKGDGGVLRKEGGGGDGDEGGLEECWKNKIWSVEVKQPQLQIARAYTPLPPTTSSTSADNATTPSPSSSSDLRFWIRHTGGELSAYLHRLTPKTSTISLRGPHTEFVLPDNTNDVLFLAGGTGIAPALQAAHALLVRRGEDEGGAQRVRILWAVRRREECVGGVSDVGAEESKSWGAWGLGWLGLGFRGKSSTGGNEVGEKEMGLIVRELEALKRAVRPGRRLEVQYFVDEEGTFIKPGNVARFLQTATPKPSLTATAATAQAQTHSQTQTQEKEQGQEQKQTTRTPTNLILLAGPDGFLDVWSGRKVWGDKGEVQGPLRGALSRMDLRGWRVWKL